MERRLARLDVLYQRRELTRVAPVFDGDRLTMADRHELDNLLAALWHDHRVLMAGPTTAT
jgi:hypothetical protein